MMNSVAFMEVTSFNIVLPLLSISLKAYRLIL